MEARNRAREEADVLESSLLGAREHSRSADRVRDASTSIKIDTDQQQPGVVSRPAASKLLSPVPTYVSTHTFCIFSLLFTAEQMVS